MRSSDLLKYPSLTIFISTSSLCDWSVVVELFTGPFKSVNRKWTNPWNPNKK